MAESSIVHVGENSDGYVAFGSMEKIAASEGRIFTTGRMVPQQSADRKWILSTYLECLSAVLAHRDN